jgi:hypothetical protein
MGDWNTLHFFDDKSFYTKIVPDLLNKGELLKKHFESELLKYFWNNTKKDQRINDILNFFKYLDKDFKSHKELYDISRRKKKPEEEYLKFLNKQNQDKDEFQEQNAQVIADLSEIMPLLLFSECANFNPHLILGRKIFTGHVDAKPKSVSEEIIWQVIQPEYGCVYSQCGTGIINWIANDELQLLWLDKDNLYARYDDSENYFQEFLKFIEIAIKNNLGLISVTNVNEGVLKLTKNPYFNIELDLDELGLKYIINYK